MRSKVETVAVLALVLAAGRAAAADAPKPKVDCRQCHTSDTPTKEKPALVKCPRAKVSGFHAVGEAVKTVVFPCRDAYGPVRFSHKAHAEMAEMGEGCGACHHYNQASSIQACKDCHSPERLREGDELGKPGLSGARHRLCLSCHRAWGGDEASSCAYCHAAAARAKPAPSKARTPTTVVFKSPSSPKAVNFPHRTHLGFSLACAECHKGASCASCHAAGRAAPATLTVRVKAWMTPDEAHASCAACHASAECAKCHGEGWVPPAPKGR